MTVHLQRCDDISQYHETLVNLSFPIESVKNVKLALASSGSGNVSISSMVLSCALPWLKNCLIAEEELELIIESDDSIEESTLNHLAHLLHFGQLACLNEKSLKETKEIARLLKLNIEDMPTEVSEDEDSIYKENEDCSDLEQNEEEEPKKVLCKRRPKMKRVFAADLSAEELTCKVCQKEFTALYKLKIHSMIHSATPPFVCSFCGRGFNNKYKMRGHEKRHCSSSPTKYLAPKSSWQDTVLDKGITCEKCGAVFDTKKARREHILAAHPLYHASTHSCPLCQKVFKALKGLNSHMANVRCQKPKKPLGSGTDSKTFSCDKCPTVCSSRKSLKIHGRTAHLEDGEDALPYRCLTCGKAFLKQSYLEEHHNRFHVLIKPFPCMFCPKRCATKQDLDRHLVSHRGETIFQCSFCPKSFVHRASLKKHHRGRLRERPYQCHPCGKSYGLLTVLHKHQKSHERKGDKTKIVTPAKGQRGALSYIDFAEGEPPAIPSSHTITNLSQMQVEIEDNHQTAGYQDHNNYMTEEQHQYPEQSYNYHVVEAGHQENLRFADLTETESIAMDILGLLGDQQSSAVRLNENPIDKL